MVDRKAQVLIDRSLSNQRESKYIEFKSEFDSSSRRAWCELIKDIVAMAHSGGGAIAFGLDNVGLPTGADVSDILEMDPADLTNKIARYTGSQFDTFQFFEAMKSGHTIGILLIEPTPDLLVFTKPGTYPIPGGQGRAFSEGVVYFRHGAKSEPALRMILRSSFKGESTKLEANG